MEIEELLRIKRKLFEMADELSVRKGRGYGNETDTLANLKLAEYAGVVPSEVGAWIRLSDKTIRIGRILTKTEQYVGFEGLLDNILDCINYATYIYALFLEKQPELKKRFLGEDV